MTRIQRMLCTLGAALALCLSLGGVAAAQAPAKPQYGGTLEVGTVYVTLSALSWDPQDWNWKLNHDTGMFYEQLFAADLDKSVRKGGKHKFYADAWLPSDAIRGELAERWEWKENPLSVVVHLRKGVMFPEKSGVMKARELTAEDVVFSYDRLDKSPKKIPTYFDHIAKVEARDKYTVVFTFKEYNAEWDYRFGWGYYSAIVPKEMAAVDAKNWKNAVGTGPFQLADFVQANSQTYVKNPGYWDTEKLGGTAYKIPFVDKLVYRTIKDEATQHSALRTGKLDILEAIRWTAVDNLKKSAPQLKWSKWLSMSGTFLAMRVDQKPFGDIRVRRALNMAVNKQEIVSAYYGGNAELFAYPMHPDYLGYYEPLEKMPASVKELFTYDPAKAKKLLAEAGYPGGVGFPSVTLVSAGYDYDEAVVAELRDVLGIDVRAERMPADQYFDRLAADPPAFWSLSWVADYPSPNDFLGVLLGSGQSSNYARWSSAEFDAAIGDALAAPDAASARDAYTRAERVVQREVPVIPASYGTGWALARDGLLGARENGLGILRLAGLAWSDR